MPEGESMKDYVHRIPKYKRVYEKLFKTRLLTRFRIFPRTWTLGTDRKKYTTCTMSCFSSSPTVKEHAPSDLDVEYDLINLDHVPEEDLRRIPENDPRRILFRDYGEGELLVQARGKELVVAGGAVATRINFGLEGHLVMMTTNDFNEIISEDCPGSSKDKHRAELMRSFKLPARFSCEGSGIDQVYIQGMVRNGKLQDDVEDSTGDDLDLDSSETEQTPAPTPASQDQKSQAKINIIAAFVGKDLTLVLVDFARLVRIHCMTLDRHWTEADLRPGSPFWRYLWGKDTGFDWSYEHHLALKVLDDFWARVLRREPGTGWNLAAVDVIATRMDIFAGFGRKTTLEMLQFLQVVPHISLFSLFYSDFYYDRLRRLLPVYFTWFDSDEYIKNVCTIPQHPNPFAFHYSSNNHYNERFNTIFRVAMAKVPVEAWVEMQNCGSMDYGHWFGEPYPVDKQVELAAVKEKFKYLPVMQLRKVGSGKVVGYTTIRASLMDDHAAYQVTRHFCGDGWNDARSDGHKSVIGPASYHNNTVNKVDERSIDAHLPGRIATLDSFFGGKVKARPSLKQIRKQAVFQSDRFQKQIQRELILMEQGELVLARSRCQEGGSSTDVVMDEPPAVVSEKPTEDDTGRRTSTRLRVKDSNKNSTGGGLGIPDQDRVAGSEGKKRRAGKENGPDLNEPAAKKKKKGPAA